MGFYFEYIWPVLCSASRFHVSDLHRKIKNRLGGKLRDIK